MQAARIPKDEAERLAALLSYDVLDTEPEQAYDDLTRIASEICGTPIALVSLVDGERQWFKSHHGLDATETPRDVAFCSHAILQPTELLIVPDSSKDERFRDNPLATGQPHVRFYAGAPLVSPCGKALGTLCVIDYVPHEITDEQREALVALSRQVVSQLELRRRNAELKSVLGDVKRANDELQQFTAIAAHDLSAPMRRIITLSDLLREDMDDDLPPEAEQDLEYIVESARRMQALITSLLELARVGTGEQKVDVFDLEDCARLALDSLDTHFKERGGRVEFSKMPFVRGDRVLLTQVFQNLMGNALKFTTSDSPCVYVTCEDQGDRVVFGVRDEGIGFEPAHAERVFEPFKRLRGGGKVQGSGIGLSVVRKVIERHGGTVWAESEPGRGSHFRFTLSPDRIVPRVAQAS